MKRFLSGSLLLCASLRYSRILSSTSFSLKSDESQFEIEIFLLIF